MIKELLEKRDLLSDIATELYGEIWVANDDFWGSPTEREMNEVQEELLTWGWEPEEPTEEQIALAEMIAAELARKDKRLLN